MREKYPSLTVNDLLVIYHYTGHGDMPKLNKKLRSGNALDPHFNSFAKLLGIALDKLPDFKGKTYRGSRLPEAVIDIYRKANKEKGIYIEKTFWSTSKDIQVAEDFAEGSPSYDSEIIFTIISKTGKDIEYISRYGPYFSADENEREVLFKPGTKFKVIEVDESELEEFYNGKIYITLQEI